MTDTQIDMVKIRLASACVHVQEYLAEGGRPVDVKAFEALMGDPDVHKYMVDLGRMALLPVRRDESFSELRREV